MKTKKLVVLGSTGSIGTQALQVAESLGIDILGISCNKNIKLLKEQIKKIKPKYVAVADEKAYSEVKSEFGAADIKIFYGEEGLKVLASLHEADMVINSISGIAGLTATLYALRAGKMLGLANKESLVVAGSLVTKTAKEFGGRILPIDSEHCAILQALRSGKRSEIKNLILTASGGPFFGMNREQLKRVTITDALNHPNWHMGKKITIDSATLLNKGFEIIEASWLFSIPIEKIKIVVHPQSVVHSLVEFKDNNMIAQLSVPDMKGVLGYVITEQMRKKAVMPELNLINSSPLEFFDVDSNTFRGIELVQFAHSRGELYLSVCNGASEELVKLFLNGQIKFTDIDEILLECLNAVTLERAEVTEDNIFWADRVGRDFIKEKMAR